MLVNLKTVLDMAEKGNFCIPAFNVYNMETVIGVLHAAEEMRAPIIMQVYPRLLNEEVGYYLCPAIVAAARLKYAPFILFTLWYISEAVQEKAAVETMFITRPIIPVSLTVTSSSKDTTRLIISAYTGPSIKPPIVITTSFASYCKKPCTAGMILLTNISTYAIAESMARVVSFFVFIIDSPFFGVKKIPR